MRIRHIASIVRDRFSADTWRILNELQTDSRTRPGRIPLANTLSLLNTLIMDLGAFSGMEMENMTRGHGWRFLDFGRRLERGANLVRLIQAALAPDIDRGAGLEPLLEIADSSMTYRRRYFSEAQLPAVLDLLLKDTTNPRSLAFQLDALLAHSSNLPLDPAAPQQPAGQKVLGPLVATLREVDFNLFADGSEGAEAIRQWLLQFENGLSDVSNELSHQYFSLTVARVS